MKKIALYVAATIAMLALSSSAYSEEITYRKHLGATEEERQSNLRLFKDWVGNWTLKKWKDITKEDMDRIKVKHYLS